MYIKIELLAVYRDTFSNMLGSIARRFLLLCMREQGGQFICCTLCLHANSRALNGILVMHTISQIQLTVPNLANKHITPMEHVIVIQYADTMSACGCLFHPVPKDRQKWIQACSKKTYICSVHFVGKCPTEDHLGPVPANYTIKQVRH